jgi:hypothetical protein
MKNGKHKTQQVWIALSDNPDDPTDFSAKITFNPSIEGRELKEGSAALNAAARLWFVLEERKGWLASKLENGKTLVTPGDFINRN